ncbi:MAG TPA: NifB/NifX family molybdenum-iron cluster-binding protein [bacterium]|nr:NifB/NifX family molybdenum-iron cluster-binding protein [bacterium]HOL66199.1 NifB/NifX family molybdenum-iron cluster-binding protein [bacterium]HPP11522.1 NifB/NifX family molybdenum-iron cluster-binding protein [bacterium]
MKVAIPVVRGRLSAHFGHCEQFAIFEVDEEEKKITGQEVLEAPEHAPGLFPRWLKKQGVQVVLVGGLGQRARAFFDECGLKVITGAPEEVPEALVMAYLNGTLVTGENICDH